jgi:hemolysin D
MKSARKIIPFASSADCRHREELEFLPAALEIVETPPSPAGRGIAWTIIAVFLAAAVWSLFRRTRHRGHRDRQGYSDRQDQADPTV